LFLNPGGPGGSGVQSLLNASEEIKNTVGPDYDLAAWEPRGIGYSVPAAAPCFFLDANATFSGPSKQKRKRSDGLKDYIVHGPNVPIESLADANTYAELGATCTKYNGKPLDAGPHMTTATVARDLMSILDAYAKTSDERRADRDPKLLNYWGYSYGTVIGQTFASMFPKRVGRVVVDGVVDPDACEYFPSQSCSVSHLLVASKAWTLTFVKQGWQELSTQSQRSTQTRSSRHSSSTVTAPDQHFVPSPPTCHQHWISSTVSKS